jgi:oxygen-independent coproporphyrinogen-3 oxidase
LHHYANTAYPLDGVKVWKPFRVKENVTDTVKSEWEDIDELGLYVHLPFCKSRCLYCEYTVLSGEEADMTEEYIDSLVKEIDHYTKFMIGKTAVGLDIGGGTPTVLDVKEIDRVMTAILKAYRLTDDFGISIETTPIIANDYDKIKGLRELGIDRISMGLQTIDPRILEQVGRADNSVSKIRKATENIRQAGFERYNLDLMYGFKNQSVDSFISTLEFAVGQEPEYITLYRNRFKGTRIEKDAKFVDLASVNELYGIAFKILNENGFNANVGKNTFSRLSDPGTSAYLTQRVIEGTPYLGMGLGAQNMAANSLYYNHGAASKRMNRYQKLISEGELPVQDLYLLPADEIMAKMISVSFYFGYINKDSFRNKFGVSLKEQFGDEMQFLTTNGLMEHNNELFQLTKQGKDAINGIIPLFYSDRSKENLLSKVNKYV